MKTLLRHARQRAEKAGVPFELTESDIVVPDPVPCLGFLCAGLFERAEEDSPSGDRIIPDKGYVPDNIAVMSLRANAIKRDATVEELTKLVHFLNTQLGA